MIKYIFNEIDELLCLDKSHENLRIFHKSLLLKIHFFSKLFYSSTNMLIHKILYQFTTKINLYCSIRKVGSIFCFLQNATVKV